MSDTVQQVKEKLDLLTYLKPLMTLTPAGKNWKGSCPFHKEKTPSFMVSPERQIWHCFGGCNTGGDIFTFVMKYENVEFYEALKILAEKAGVDLRRSGGGDWQKYNRLYEINEAAKDFFCRVLTQTGPDAAFERVRHEVNRYLAERGLRPETIADFELGLAPVGPDALVRKLTQAGFSINELETAGLVFRTERGTYWDRFRGRLMFPLYNSFGKVVGFTARLLPGSPTDLAKYVNSPETPIFQKSKFLYGFHRAKEFIREDRVAVLVEGQMDFLMAWQDGVRNAAATSGTALTADHLAMLKRVADQLVLSFDRDEAGQLAMERSIELAFAEDLSVKVLQVPETIGESRLTVKDPADIARQHPGLLAQLVTQAIPAVHYYFQRHLAGTDRDPLQKKKGVRAVLAKMKYIASPVERSAWLKELGERAGVDQKILEEELTLLLVPTAASAKPAAGAAPAGAPTAIQARKDVIAKRIFGLAHHHPEFQPEIAAARAFFPATHQSVLDYFSDPAKPCPAEVRQLLDVVGFQPDGTKQELNNLLRQLKLEYYKYRQRALRETIRRAEQNQDQAQVKQMLAEFDIISRELDTIKNYTHGYQAKDDSEQEEGIVPAPEEAAF